MIALRIGGAAAAPLSAWVTRHVPTRAAATAVGLAVVVPGAAGLVNALN